jgi:hypothetical protein
MEVAEIQQPISLSSPAAAWEMMSSAAEEELRFFLWETKVHLLLGKSVAAKLLVCLVV